MKEPIMIDVTHPGGRVSPLNLVLIVLLRVALYATILRLLRPVLGTLPGLAFGGVLVAVGGMWFEAHILFHLLRWAGVTQPIPPAEVSPDTGGPPLGAVGYDDAPPGINDCTAQHHSGANCRLMIGHEARGKPYHFNPEIGTWCDEHNRRAS
jgi:hypothetical protein